MTTTEVNNGLVLPYAAITIAGKGGAAGVLLITFMAVTSTLSAQVIAVSSILSFDIYRQYFNKQALDRDVIRWSHYGVVFFGVFSAAFSTLLHYVGVDLGWTLYMLGKIQNPKSSFARPSLDQYMCQAFSRVLEFFQLHLLSFGNGRVRPPPSSLLYSAWPRDSQSGLAPRNPSTDQSQ